MEYGKFKSPEELLKGYEELEKSFTKKCQQLSELEKRLSSGTSENSPPQNTASDGESGAQIAQTVPKQQPDGVVKTGESLSEQAFTEQHLEDNFRELPEKVAPVVITDGGNVSLALPNRPKTLAEASDLAKQLFK